MFLFFSLPGGSEWFVILLVALLLFGKRLPDVARAMGQSITEFKRGLQNITDDIHTSQAEKNQKTTKLSDTELPIKDKEN